MRTNKTFSKTDILVSILCIFFLITCLGAIGNTGRRRAKEMVCLSNLMQWGKFFDNYTKENDNEFPSGLTAQGYWWPLQIDPDFKDWKKNRLWFCPTATVPIIDENGNQPYGASIFNAWGIFRETQTHFQTGVTYDTGPNGIAGSYAINGYVLSIPIDSTFESGVPAYKGWRNPNLAEADNIPLFIDSLRFDMWPLNTSGPAPDEYASWSGDHIARSCINRHNGAVCSLFLDFSARKVGLKELWTLKWYQDFNTAGPWTQAGGVQPNNWPSWMRGFKDY